MMDFDPWGREPEWARSIGKDKSATTRSNEEDEEDEAIYAAHHILLMVDCRPCMFERNESTKRSPMDVSLMALETYFREKVFSVTMTKTGKRDGMGVTLFGCTKDPNSSKSDDDDDEEDDDDDDDDESTTRVPPTYNLVELKPPGTEGIGTIRDCVRGDRELENDFCDASETVSAPLRMALTEAEKILKEAKCVRDKPAKGQPPDKKSVWVFTSGDDFVEGDEESHRLLSQSASDRKENGISIRIINVGRTEFPEQVEEEIANDGVYEQFDPKDMAEDFANLWKKKRRALSFPILLPDWRCNLDHPGIMVDAFRPVDHQKRPQKETVSQQTLVKTQRTTQQIRIDTGEFIGKEAGASGTLSAGTAVHEYVVFAKKNINISNEDKQSLIIQSSAQDKASLIILGFREINDIPLHYTLGKAYCLRPNEQLVRGSTEAFSALYFSMLEKKVAAIGEFLSKTTSVPRLVALFPQKEVTVNDNEEDEDGGEWSYLPSALVLVELPYEDDVRKMGTDEGNTASADLVEETKDLLRRNFQVPRFGRDYENAQLDRFRRYLESVALGTRMSKKVYDDTELDEKEFMKRAGAQLDAFRDSLPDDTTKTSTSPRATSRKRKPAEVFDDSGVDWDNLYATGKLKTKKVAELKIYLKTHGLPVSGKKDDLIARIEQHMGG